MRCIGANFALAAGFSLAALLPCVAHAGNDDAVLLGNQAMLTGGAVTAIVSDGASAWFNPAGLGHATRNQLDVTGSAYGLNVYKAKSLLVLPDGNSADAKVTDWILVPSVLSYTRELNENTVVSFGLFVPRTNDFELRTGVTTNLDQTVAATLTTILNEYDYALSIAQRVGPGLRLGATLAGIYLSRRDFSQVALGTSGATDQPFYTGSDYTAEGDYGLRMTVGLQWEPAADWVLGVSLQSPIFTGWSDVSSTRAVGSATPDAGLSAFQLNGQQGIVGVWDFTTPARLRVGVAYQLGATQLLLDGDVSTPIQLPAELPDATFYDRDWVGNVRVGVLQQVSPGMTVGGGLFTDLSGRKQFKTQFAGVALGVELESQHTADEKKRELTFSTSMGVRYAYGWGDVRGVQLVSDGMDYTQQPNGAPVTVHEVALNIGGGVDF
ncbi:MAG TPA: hypothetical protein VJU61_07420 [Polyangiaceae bacterium]|nr:hypothetical protein [Polyangiaceae bacterium]